MYDSMLTAQDINVEFEFAKLDIIPPVKSLDESGNSEAGISAEIDAAEETDSQNKELLGRISERIAAYALLYDIPFCYLLPDEELLPPNSLRFFYLDNNWVLSLMDGALSLGRTVEIDIKHDQTLAHDAYSQAMLDAEKIRRVLQGREPLPPVQNISGETFEPELCTGFLLRSPLVTGWRGLEFNAYDKNGKTLKALRIEVLAHDVLLALFLGEIDSFTLAEPPEGLHYGLEISETGLCAGLRSFKDGKQDGKTIFAIQERGRRVINFAATAANIAKTSREKIDITQMDSAKMALQLTRTACKLTVKVGRPLI